MGSLSSVKIIIGIAVLVIFGALSYLFYISTNNEEDYNDTQNKVSDSNASTTDQVKVPELNIPEGWETYTGDENRWKRGDLRIAFAYPSGWKRSEEISNQKLTAVTLKGDDYSIRIDQAGRGTSRPYDYTQSIGGFNARVWEDTTEFGKEFMFGITDIDFVIYITAPSNKMEVILEILSSIKFYR